MKKTLALILALCMVFALCISGAASAEERKTIEWCCSWTSETENIEKLVELANQELPFDIELTWPSDYNQTLVSRFAANDYPAIYNTETYMWNTLYTDQSLALDDCSFWDNLDEGIFAGIEATDGTKIAVPGFVQAYGIIYNLEVLKSVGYETVPTTLSEFNALCEALVAADIDPIAPTQMEDWTTRQLWLFPFGYDADLAGTYAKMAAGELAPADVEWINKEVDFLDTYKKYVGAKAFDDSTDTAVAKVVTGQAAMLVQGDWELVVAAGVDPDVVVGMAGIPISEDANDCRIYYSLGTCTHVCKQSEDAELAKQFVEWWYTSETAKDWWVNTFCKPHCFKSYDTSISFGLTQALELVKAGHFGGWGSQVVPEEVVTEITPLCERYILNDITRDEYLTMMGEKMLTK